MRRELETDLKEQEARLRVNGELQLRMNERSWEMLRNVQEAGFRSFEAVRSYVVAAVYSRNGGHSPPGAEYDSALEAIGRLSGLSECSPPQYQGIGDGAKGLQAAFNAAVEASLPDSTTEIDKVLGMAKVGRVSAT